MVLDEEIRKQIKMQIENSHHVALFLPISRFNEIDLRPLLAEKNTHWYAPISYFEERRMEFVPVSENEDFKVSEEGIPEPLSRQFVNPELLDAMIIPMLICDKRGYRVGYGKGFYDAFLKRCRPDCKRIGVNYFPPIQEITDIDDHDETIDFCIFPHTL